MTKIFLNVCLLSLWFFQLRISFANWQKILILTSKKKYTFEILPIARSDLANWRGKKRVWDIAICQSDFAKWWRKFLKLTGKIKKSLIGNFVNYWSDFANLSFAKLANSEKCFFRRESPFPSVPKLIFFSVNSSKYVIKFWFLFKLEL